MRDLIKKGTLPLLFLWFALPQTTYGTHIRAADVIVERICGTLTFKVTIVVYLNSTSTTPFGAASEISFGDGTAISIPITSSTPRPDLGENVSVASFTTEHTFSQDGIYEIKYIERDRSTGILNIANSHDVAYACSVTINTDPKYGCNNYPKLQVPPIDKGCSAAIFYHNPGAFDADGDSLSYEFSIPASAPGVEVIYDSPADAKFYTDYEHGNEAKDGPPFINIDTTGTVTWDAPGAVGEYTIAFKIIEWRKNDDNVYEQISVTVRDMQIIIEACANKPPVLIIPENVCVIAGETVIGVIKGTDPENHHVKIEAFSEIFDFAESPAIYSPTEPDFVPSEPPAELHFQWPTVCSHVRQQAYQVILKITDDPPEGPRLVSFQTWTIKVVAPPPLLETATLNVVKNYGVLGWDDYTCEATNMQVWRKVGSLPDQPGNCTPGIPRNSGYALITETPGDATNFTDTNFGAGLSPGATYCYRLVAVVNDAKSIVSQELCIGPIKRDAPVITHVSVEKTDELGGVRVSWRSPVDINKTQFPEPYNFEVYRAQGFYGDAGIINAGITTDTTFLDQGVNTTDSVFNYRIVVYSKPEFSDEFVPVDTSAIASSVRLSAEAGIRQITLHWEDSVAWSNVIPERPYHLIYRAEGVVDDDQLTLIDSVHVIDNGFNYIDAGQFNNQPLKDNRIYTYKVMTQGTYGTPDIAIQKNFSQKISIYPENNLKPCAPFVTVDITDCNTFINSNTCDQNIFDNALTWEADLGDTCRIDLVHYKIYAADNDSDEFELIATVDTVGFIDKNLATPARCYRVTAVDSKGNEGPQSESRCNDTCPYYQLPNVFTPNADGCNDLFTARFRTGDNSIKCEDINEFSCPRFVQSVNVTIYNRWGKEVYHYFSNDKDAIYIDWDGKDAQGHEMATGIYYYVGEIEFRVLDEAKQKITLKNWLHLVR